MAGSKRQRGKASLASDKEMLESAAASSEESNEAAAAVLGQLSAVPAQ
jgi:hypothetical protein